MMYRHDAQDYSTPARQIFARYESICPFEEAARGE